MSLPNTIEPTEHRALYRVVCLVEAPDAQTALEASEDTPGIYDVLSVTELAMSEEGLYYLQFMSDGANAVTFEEAIRLDEHAFRRLAVVKP